MSEQEPEAHVYVEGFDPEVYTGERALLIANAAASLFREDFPGKVIGVAYNPAAAEDARRHRLADMGLADVEVGSHDG